MLNLLVLFLLLGSHAIAAPTITLIARANLEDGYRLPPGSFIDNTSPAINDKGSVAFKVLSFLDGKSGVVIVPAGEESKLVHASESELYLTDVSLTSHDEVYFSEFSETGPMGIYRFHQDQLKKIFSVDDLFDFSAVGMPVANSGGFCFKSTRGSDARANREILCTGTTGGELKKIFGEGQPVKNGERASYIFTPGFNGKGEFAAKMRLGSRGEFAEERPDVVALVNKTGVHVLVSDINADSASKFTRFNNSVSLNNHGEVALVATTMDNKSCLLLASEASAKVKVCDGEFGIKVIEYFAPQLNDRGSLAFRAFDMYGKRQIYLFKKGDVTPQKLVGEDDLITTDVGETRITFREGFPGLSGNLGLNGLDQIVFHAILGESGAGIFVVQD
ncbi:MAG TPA: hypothetical protein VNJ08_17385 [Bacteriovoracaceae bacterium]|nr:hypothetical protein [Bacteriovoracaceae bacterium]